MAKSLRDITGTNASKVVKLNHKDMYQWNSPDGLKFVDDKHPVDKHEDRVGNGDDVYKGKTKEAAYKKQSDGVYEETLPKKKRAVQDGRDFYDEKSGERVASYGKDVVKHDRDIEGAKKAREHFNKNHKTHSVHEEAEELDEVSKEKTVKYLKAVRAKSKAADEEGKKSQSFPDAVDGTKKTSKETLKRGKGIIMALDKLSGNARVNAKEEVELDEVSKKLMANYISGDSKSKSGGAVHNKGFHDSSSQEAYGKAEKRVKDRESNLKKGDGHRHKSWNRREGIDLAVKKLSGNAKVNATEETEVDEGYKVGDRVNLSNPEAKAHHTITGKSKTHYKIKKGGSGEEIDMPKERIAKVNKKAWDIRKDKAAKHGGKPSDYNEETDVNITNQKLGAGEKKTALLSFIECNCSECNNTAKGMKCEVHGMDECPGYSDKKGRKLLTDKKKAWEGIEIGKALRVGNQFTDTHLAKEKRNPANLGKPADLLHRANKTIGKLKGSTFLVKKLTEEQLHELSMKVLASYIKKASNEMGKIANKDPANRTFKDTDKYYDRAKGVDKAKDKIGTP